MNCSEYSVMKILLWWSQYDPQLTNCRHECYNECMKTTQYTIRNIPEPVNRYLRKKVQLSGKSLNQVIIDDLSEKAAPSTSSVASALSWFIGSGMDQATLSSLEQEDKLQKRLAAQELLDAS
jgi:hypothetical protein